MTKQLESLKPTLAKRSMIDGKSLSNTLVNIFG